MNQGCIPSIIFHGENCLTVIILAIILLLILKKVSFLRESFYNFRDKDLFLKINLQRKAVLKVLQSTSYFGGIELCFSHTFSVHFLQ